MSEIAGKDVIAIPMTYYDEFKRDAMDSLLKYGDLPQRARAPYFTNAQAINKALCLPDQVAGEKATKVDEKAPAGSIVGGRDPEELLLGINPHFGAWDDALWHVHIDLALNKKRHGDAAGIAMGRITDEWLERKMDPSTGPYERLMRSYEIPLVAQIVAPPGDQVYITSVVIFVLALKQLRGFNITSYSFDGWQSVEASQQLMLAGLVTAGMKIDEQTGDIEGLPKPFSVDGLNIQPYRELLEVVGDERCKMPNYGWLHRELRQLEVVDPSKAPDHPIGGSKDVADPCAGVVGYLAAFGHAVLFRPADAMIDRTDLEEQGVLQPAGAHTQFQVEGEGGMGTNFNEGLDEIGQDFRV